MTEHPKAEAADAEPLDERPAAMTAAGVALRLLQAVPLKQLRSRARSSARWRSAFPGFRPTSITNDQFVRAALIFSRDINLLKELAEQFLDSLGAPSGGSLRERFSAAAQTARPDEATPWLCRLLAETDLSDLPRPRTPGPMPSLPAARFEQRTVGAGSTSQVPPNGGESEPLEHGETPASPADAHGRSTQPGRLMQRSQTVTAPTPLQRFARVDLEWEPPDDHVTEAQQAVTLFERALVRLMIRQLRALYGDAWLSKGCGATRQKWQERAEKGTAAEPETLIGYAELGELLDVLVRKDNWPAFAPYFDNPESLRQDVRKIIPLRVSAMHAAQRSLALVEHVDGLAAMVKLAKSFHPGTVTKIDELFRETLAQGAPEGTGDVTALRIQTNLGDFPGMKLVGRDDELGKIQEYWDDEYVRVVSIIGEGGIGKTALLDAFVSGLLGKSQPGSGRPDPEVIVYLTAKETYLEHMWRPAERLRFKTLRRILEATLETLGGDAGLEPDDKELRRSILSSAKTFRILFAVDNLESLDEEEHEAVRSFLDDLPSPSKALVTTRINRRIGREVHLKNLPTPHALKLLLDRLESAGVLPSEDDFETVNQIVSYTNGFPLALVWSANQISSGYTISETLELLKGKGILEFLEFSFESSLALLDQPRLEALLFLALSKHPLSRKDLLTFASDDQHLSEILEALIDRSFVAKSWQEKRQVRFVMDNPLLSDYVKQRIPQLLPTERYAFVLQQAKVSPAQAESPSVSIEIERAIEAANELSRTDWRAAIETLEAARSKWGEDARLLARLGYLQYRVENRGAARFLLKQALDMGYENAEVFVHLALALFYDQEYDEALRMAESALKRRAVYPQAEQVAGQCLFRKAERNALMLDDRDRLQLLERALAHLRRSLVEGDERFRSHNQRTLSLMPLVEERIAGIKALF